MQEKLYAGLLVFLILFSAHAKDSDPLSGLKDYELELLRDSRMPVGKLQQIKDAGITLDEYFQYPWIKLNLSEKEWLAQRKAGILKSEDYSTQQLKNNQWAVIQNFFVPGLHQFKRKQYFRGILMSGIAVSSLALFALHRKPGNNGPAGFDYPAYLAVLGVDLLWSSIDLGVQVNRQFDNGAKRFSYDSNINNTALTFFDNSISLDDFTISPFSIPND